LLINTRLAKVCHATYTSRFSLIDHLCQCNIVDADIKQGASAKIRIK